MSKWDMVEMKISLKLAANKSTAHKPPTPRDEKHAFVVETKPTPVLKGSLIGAGRRILVVDDNAVVLKSFELKLRASGFKVATLQNAAAVASAAERSSPELIILDINFPASESQDWSGYTSLRWLRRFPELARIPVIFVSGEDATQHKERALAEGAAAYFQKPVAYSTLLAQIVHLLAIKA